jgi:ABC-type transport system involved in multi-copper enzyme maturation permease subunit
MNWLFWKEYRQNRAIVIALLVMLAVPHLFGLYAMWYQWHEWRLTGFSWQTLLEAWESILIVASLCSLGISQVALAFIGGNAIAGERADRSAEFQAYLPLTRKKILVGKLLLALLIAAAIWLINPVIVWGALASSNQGMPSPPVVPLFMIHIAITGLVFFCVAWFFSTILRSPTFSVVAGLVTPLIIWSLVLYGNYLIQGDDHWKPGTESVLQICEVCISFAVALSGFGFGTWLYLRRVEP